MKIFSISFSMLSIMTVASNVEANYDCLRSKIKFFKYGKPEITKAKICTNEDRNLLISLSCFRTKKVDGKRVKCDALNFKEPRSIEFSNLLSEFGKPGSNLCRLLDGEFQIVSFLAGKKWYKLDRCIFESDNSYVDTGYLIDQYFDKQ